MGHTPADDGREVFAAVLPDPLDGGDFVVRHAREHDVPLIAALVDDEMRARLTLPDVIDETMTRQMVLHGGALVIADAGTDLPLGGMRFSGAAARRGRNRLAPAAVPARAADDDRQRAERAGCRSRRLRARRARASDRVPGRAGGRDDSVDPGARARVASVRRRRGRRALPSRRRP